MDFESSTTLASMFSIHPTFAQQQPQILPRAWRNSLHNRMTQVGSLGIGTCSTPGAMLGIQNKFSMHKTVGHAAKTTKKGMSN